MVGCASLGFGLKLEDVYYYLQPFTQFEPEIYPALYYHQGSGHPKVSIFHTGKMIFTGVRDEMQMYQLFNNLREKVSIFKRNY